ncbi:MAG TPA: hypothetical protein ENK18_04335 [Deltaproteobacteria bacterium]|nr:hypothetical protein [Deltaproteobacteria bacterium]
MSETRWDERGRIVDHQRTLTIPGEPVAREGFSWIYEGDLLIEEIVSYWEEPYEVSPLHQAHSYDDQGRRIRTELWRGDAGPAAADAVGLGVWTWSLDDAGRPSGGSYDYDGDGVEDGFREEVWTKQAYGWLVQSSEELFGWPGMVIEEELDESERLLWRSEDWDGDGGTDRVEHRVYVPGAPDDRELLSEWGVSGPSVVDESCTYEHDDLSRIASSCSDELHDGWFETRYRFEAPERVASGTSWHHTGGDSELWEHLTYTWRGCL